MNLKIKSSFKYITLVVGLFSVIISLLILQGCEKIESDAISFDQIKKEYNLKVIKDLPEGQKFMNVSSVEELEKMLKSIKNRSKLTITGKCLKNQLSINGPKLNSGKRLKSGGFEDVDMTGNPDGWWFESLHIDMSYIDSSSPITISSQMQGFQLGVGYTQNSANASFNSNGKITFHIDGTESYYVVVKGIGTVYTNPISVDGTYDPATGSYQITCNN